MRGSEFAELKAFAAIVERASFARAAEQLGLSPSALSQTIRQLEARLGVRLLNRTTRSVAPTAAGSRLYERIAPMILELDAAVADAVASRAGPRARYASTRWAWRRRKSSRRDSGDFTGLTLTWCSISWSTTA